MQTAFSSFVEPVGIRTGARIGLDLEAAIEPLLRMDAVIVPDSYSRRGREFVVERMSLGRYLADGPRVVDGLRHLCPEMLVDAATAAGVHFTCSFASPAGEAYAVAHAGHAGDASALHFDWDFAWVLQACLAGRKRFVFVPPAGGWLLQPVVNESAIALRDLGPQDRGDLLRMTGGSEVTLRAGEAVLFPALWWHGVVYEDTTLALSIRFAAPEWARQARRLPPSWLLQRLAWELTTADPAERNAMLDAIERDFAAPGTPLERRARLCERMTHELERRGCRHGVRLTSSAFDAERALAGRVIETLYSLPPPDRRDGAASTRGRIDARTGS